MNKMRESFGSRLGFILASAGCAIGIGNVWKFPYVAGQNGGGIFVLFYLVFLVLMGIPILIMELSIGRASRETIVQGYKKIEKKGTKWHLHGWACIAGNYILMMFYSTVAGWMLAYFFKFLKGDFRNIKADKISGIFSDLLENPVEMLIYTTIIIVVGFAVLSLGVNKGLERFNKYMMAGLFILILVLALNSVMLKNSGAGLRFYLLPNLATLKKVGILKVITAAMTQAFFTLSLGIACMEVFGSYMSNNYTLAGEAVKICALDTVVALISGLIIFPACFAYGIKPTEGPSLIFIAIPSVFANMKAGWMWGGFFFMFLTFASFSTVIGVFENLISSMVDTFNWSRKKAVIVNMIIVFFTSIPCILGFNIWKNIHLIGNRDIQGSEDFIVTNLLLPIGSLIYVLFCTTKHGWGADNFLEEANKGKGLKIKKVMIPYFKYILPILIVIIIIAGIV